MASDDVKPQEQTSGQELDLGTEVREGAKGNMGALIGAAFGLAIGMVFVLGGFWQGLVCLIFALVGAALGKIFLEG